MDLGERERGRVGEPVVVNVPPHAVAAAYEAGAAGGGRGHAPEARRRSSSPAGRVLPIGRARGPTAEASAAADAVSPY